MKQNLALILCLTAIFSCNKTEVDVVENSDAIYASIEDCKTKTCVDGNKYIRWSEGDQIAIYINSTSKVKYQVEDSSVGESHGTFRKITSDDEVLDENSAWSQSLAFYPYDLITGCSVLNSYFFAEVNLPCRQTYSERSFGNGTFPMVSIQRNNNLSFRNICGAVLLQFIGNECIRSIEFRGNDRELITGKAVVSVYSDDTAPSITMTGSTDYSVTLDCGSGVQLNEDTPTSFIITLPPTKFTYGFTVVLTNDKGEEYTISTDKENTIFRSSMLVMPALIIDYKANEPSEYDYIDEEGINYGSGIAIDGVIWAPVNCGYKTPKGNDKGYPYGKLYQWGRKHGQGYSTDDDRDIPTVVSGPVPLIESLDETYSNIFINAKSSPYDWNSASCDYLWNAGTEENPLKTEYDPCPEGWRVPTYSEARRLTQNRSELIYKDNMFGYYVSGSVPYSSDVPQIYLEGIGYRQSNGNADYRGYANGFWTSTGGYNNESYYFYSYSSRNGITTDVRSNGYSVRCVKDSDNVIPISQIELSATSLTMYLNKTYELKSTLFPSDANHQFTHWSSSDYSVVQVDQNGILKSMTPGTATITAVAGHCYADCVVTVLDQYEMIDYVDEYSVNHGPGIKIGLTVWAPVNCGYKSPTPESKGYPYGKLYQWGRKYGQGYTTDYDETQATFISGPVSLEDGQSEVNAEYFIQHDSNWLDLSNSKLWNSGSDTSPEKTQYDPCPSGWRVPTTTELSDLEQKYLGFSTDENGIQGSSFGSEENQIFLPLAGYIYGNGTITARKIYGHYWSSVEKYSRYLYLSKTSSNILGWANKSDAFSVRCVME